MQIDFYSTERPIKILNYLGGASKHRLLAKRSDLTFATVSLRLIIPLDRSRAATVTLISRYRADRDCFPDEIENA